MRLLNFQTDQVSNNARSGDPRIPYIFSDPHYVGRKSGANACDILSITFMPRRGTLRSRAPEIFWKKV